MHVNPFIKHISFRITVLTVQSFYGHSVNNYMILVRVAEEPKTILRMLGMSWEFILDVHCIAPCANTHTHSFTHWCNLGSPIHLSAYQFLGGGNFFPHGQQENLGSSTHTVTQAQHQGAARWQLY